MRTTLDIDGPILRELKARARREGKSLGRLASDLLARALRGGEDSPAPGGGGSAAAAWICKPMGARVDLSDAEALYAAMERESSEKARVADEE